MKIGYLLRRLFWVVIVIIGATLIGFLITKLAPGDPARVILGVQANPEDVAALREKLGLNRPIIVQYGQWLGDIFKGDFGTSLVTGNPIGPILLRRLSHTFQLGAAGMLVGMLIAFPLGVISAVKRGSNLDIGVTVFTQVGISIPKFWLATLLVIVFSVVLGWLPALGYKSLQDGFIPWIKHLILPAVTMGLGSAAIQTRFIRSAVLEVLNKDYVRTARSKGLPENRVIYWHVLRNAMINIVTILGLQMASMISIAVVVEIVFAWPGLGRLALEAVLDRDYTLLRSSIAVIATLVAMINLGVDVLYFFLDPRIEYK